MATVFLIVFITIVNDLLKSSSGKKLISKAGRYAPATPLKIGLCQPARVQTVFNNRSGSLPFSRLLYS